MIKKTLDETLVRMIIREPVFSRIARALRKRSSNEIPTAGVRVVDGRFELLVNEDFFSKLTEKQRIGLMKHEMLHLMLDHCTGRSKPGNHTVWNIACDLAINTMIPVIELPPGGLLPGEKCGEGALADLIETLPVNRSSEFYYATIMQDDKAAEENNSEEKKK